MRLNPSLLLLAALLPLSAHAASLDSFSVTGTESNNTQFSLAFQLPSSYTAPILMGGTTTFTAVPILVNGVANETATITIQNTQFFTLNLNDPNFDNFAINSQSPFESLANGIDTFITGPTNQAATYINCSVKLVRPRTPLSSALAFATVPTFSLTCPALSNLAITPAATTVTPEPPTFALLLLGAAALAGTLYTQVLRHAV